MSGLTPPDRASARRTQQVSPASPAGERPEDASRFAALMGRGDGSGGDGGDEGREGSQEVTEAGDRAPAFESLLAAPPQAPGAEQTDTPAPSLTAAETVAQLSEVILERLTVETAPDGSARLEMMLKGDPFEGTTISLKRTGDSVHLDIIAGSEGAAEVLRQNLAELSTRIARQLRGRVHATLDWGDDLPDRGRETRTELPDDRLLSYFIDCTE